MGYIAQRLKLPIMVGYLVAGVAMGPYSPGFRSDPNLVRALSEIGVAFLMFAVGTHLNLRNLRQAQHIGFLGGLLQVAAWSLMGALVARTLGRWSWCCPPLPFLDGMREGEGRERGNRRE